MHALPFVVALAVAAILAPALLRTLSEGGHTRANYRGRALPFPFGVLVLVAALFALIPLTLVDVLASVRLFIAPLVAVALYSLGVLALGLVDDMLARDTRGDGTRRVRGWRGHGAALARGELSTGAIKAFGSLGLALLATRVGFAGSYGRWLLATGVLVLATNAFNLLDLRPGRATKAFVLLGAGMTVGSADLRPLWALGLFVGPALVAGAYDLRERAMLGDTGANLLGALAGLWLVLTLSTTGQLIALALLAVITVYGEFRSISTLIERTPGLRQLDAFGRP